MFLANLSNYFLFPKNTWALARTFIVCGPILTLLFNGPANVHPFKDSILEMGRCIGPVSISFTCTFDGGSYSFVSHLFYLASFLFIASGFIPSVTGLLHVYVAFSWHNSLATTDGGDAVGLVLSILMLPICLLDWRVNHWQDFRYSTKSLARLLQFSTARVFTTALAIQVSLIYLVAGLSKLSEPTWADGTSLYYWTNGAYFQPSDLVNNLLQPILSVPLLLLFLTWAPIVLEVTLGVSLLASDKFRKPLFLVAVLFHLGIGVVFGIWSFSITMIGALLLLFHPNWLVDYIRGITYNIGRTVWPLKFKTVPGE